MKTLKIIVLLSLICFFAVQASLYCETIYTKDGKTIKAVIAEETEEDEELIWYEAENGDLVEYFSIERPEVVKILNDDGSVSKYSPTYCEECEKK